MAGSVALGTACVRLAAALIQEVLKFAGHDEAAAVLDLGDKVRAVLQNLRSSARQQDSYARQLGRRVSESVTRRWVCEGLSEAQIAVVVDQFTEQLTTASDEITVGVLTLPRTVDSGAVRTVLAGSRMRQHPEGYNQAEEGVWADLVDYTAETLALSPSMPGVQGEMFRALTGQISLLRSLLLPPEGMKRIEGLWDVLVRQRDELLAWFGQRSLGRRLLEPGQKATWGWIQQVYQTLDVWVGAADPDTSDESRPTAQSEGLAVERANAGQQAQPWDTAYADMPYRGLVVLGDAGQGKSWLLHYEALRATLAAVRCLEEQEAQWWGPLPVFATCRDVAAGTGSLTDRVCASLTSLELDERTVDTARAALRAGVELRLFLDGWDEMTGTEPDDLSRALARWQTSTARRGSVVVSSRPAGLGDPGGLKDLPRWVIKPLRPEQTLSLASLWQVADATRNHIKQEMDRRTAIGRLLSLPLVATLVCDTYRTDNVEWPTNSAILWKDMVWKLIQQCHRLDDPDLVKRDPVEEDNLHEVWELARYVAWRANGGQDGPRQATYKTRWLNERAREGRDLFDGRPSDIVQRLVSSGLMTNHSQEEYEFVHRSFAEFLAATVVADLVGGESFWGPVLGDMSWEIVIGSRIRFQRDWDEIVTFVGCCTEHPTPYVKWLLKQPDMLWRPLQVAARIAVQVDDQETHSTVETAVLPLLNPEVFMAIPQSVLRDLAQVPGDAVTWALIGLAGDSDPNVQQVASYAWASRPGDEVTRALPDPPKDPGHHARDALAGMLADMSKDYLAENVIGLAKDPDPEMRVAAAYLLADLAEHGVTPALGGRTGGDLRAALTDVLPDRSGDEVTQALIGLAQDPDFGVRQVVTRALADRPGNDATWALIGLAQNSDLGLISEAAAYMLAGRPGNDVTRALLCAVLESNVYPRILLAQEWTSLADVLADEEWGVSIRRRPERAVDIIETLVWESQSQIGPTLTQTLKSTILESLEGWWQQLDL